MKRAFGYKRSEASSTIVNAFNDSVANRSVDSASHRDSSEGWFTPLRFGLLLALFLVVAFWKVAIGQESFFYRDYGAIGYGFIHYHHESFWRGELPLWNPYSNCGAPFLAQWGTMVLYPFSLIYLLFPLPWSLSYFCLGHLLLGGMGMYFLAYRWTSSRFGASVAGFAFIINGATFSSLIWPNYAVALGWMPWVVSLVEQAWRDGGRKIVLAAILAALQLLSGVPEVVVFTWVVLAGLWVLEMIRAKETRWVVTRRVMVIVVLVAGLTAAQILPFLDLLAHSQRDRSFTDTRWAMPGWGWANFLVPLFRCFETPQGIFFQYDQSFLSSYYLGGGVLVLAVVVAWTERRREVWLLAALTLFSLVMALGENGILYGWLKRILPVLAVGRFPVKFAFLTAFAVSLLAAFSFRAGSGHFTINDPVRRRALQVVCGGSIGLILVILWFARRYPMPYDQWDVTLRSGLSRGVILAAFVGVMLLGPRLRIGGSRIILPLLLLGIHGVDILTHAPTQNPSLPVALFEPGLARSQFPAAPPEHGTGRAMISPVAERALTSDSVRDLSQEFIGKRLALWSNLNLLERVPKVNGSSTLLPYESWRVQRRLYDATNAAPAGLLDFLGVALVTAPGKIVEWTTRDGRLPLVTVGPKPHFVEATNALERIFAPDLNPRREVYLPLEAKPFITATNEARARIIAAHYAPRRIELEIESDRNCLVVVAQSFYHRWRAKVEGRTVPIWRANYAFQACEVPRGSHHVSLVYEDRALHVGTLISVGTLGLCAGGYYRTRRRASRVEQA